MKSKLRAVYHVNGSTERYDVENYFVASDRPFFLGLIIEPSAGLWAYLKNSSDIVMEFSGKSANFKVYSWDHSVFIGAIAVAVILNIPAYLYFGFI